MNCLCCGQLLQFNTKKNLYICPNCLELFSPEEIDQNKINKTDISIVDMFPSVITHEYSRIIDLLKSNQIYGAVLQCKDMLEVMLKFPVLISSAEIYSKVNKTIDDETALFQLLQNQLSLGHWLGIARDFLLNAKKDIDINKNIKEILIGVVQLYQTYSFTSWRNDTIGHGALKMDQEAYKNDLLDILELVKSHFQQFRKHYQQIVLYTKINGIKNELIGEKKVKDIEFKNPHIFVDLDGVEICLYPFFFLYNKSIYFFDSYNLNQKSTSALNYPLGLKQVSKIQDLTNTFLRLKGMLSKHLTYELFQEKSFEDEITTKDEDSFLNSFLDKRRLLAPHYIEGELRRRMSLFNKETGLDQGIFLLSMEAGMGKTTFTKIADELQFNMSELRHKLTIRSFSINDTNKQNVNLFKQSVEEELLSIRKNETITKMFFQYETPLRFENNGKHEKEQFANLLNYYCSKHRLKNPSKEGLMFIIDGIDEIKPGNGETIFDYIPESHLLEKNVFIILTSRIENTDTLTHFTKEKLRGIKIDQYISVHRQDKNYIEFLQQYMNAKLKIQDQNEIGKMLESADYRFLNIPMLGTLCQNGFVFSNIEKQTDIIKQYLKYLETMYSPKFFSSMKTILIIAATTNESLTLKEFSFLLGESRISYTLLGYINDLREFLSMERDSYRGNTFTISHQDVKDYIIENYKEEVKNYINKWIKQLLSIVDMTLVQPEEIYMYSNIFSYSLKYNDELFSHFPIDDVYGKLYKLTEGVLSKGTPEERHIIIRWIYLIESQCDYLESSGNLSEADMEKLVCLYVFHAELITEFSLDDSFIAFTKAINYYKELQKLGFQSVLNKKYVFKAFAGRVNKALFYLWDINNFFEYTRDDILVFINELKGINEELFDKNSSEYVKNEMQILYDLGAYYSSSNKRMSYSYFYDTISLYEKNKESLDETFIVDSYRELAFSYSMEGRFSEALDYINKAIFINGRTFKTQLNKLDYSSMLLIRSGILRDGVECRDMQAAYSDLTEAQKIIDQLTYEGFPINASDLMKICFHTIAFYLDSNRVGKAFDQFCQFADKSGILSKNKKDNINMFALLASGYAMLAVDAQETNPISKTVMNSRLNKIIDYFNKDYIFDFTGVVNGFQRKPSSKYHGHHQKKASKKRK